MRTSDSKKVLLATLVAGTGVILAGSLSPQDKLETVVQQFEPVKNDTKTRYEPISYKTDDLYKDSDEVLLARLIFGEARNCHLTEKIAVGYTAINRVNDGKKWNGETLRETILKPKQYSCFDINDINKVKLMNPEECDKKSFGECLEVARGILAGKYQDPTNGADHYCNLKFSNPSWTKKMDRIGKIPTEKGLSKHDFYKDK